MSNQTQTKPYTQTSYFRLLLAVVFLGPLFLWVVSQLLPQFPLSPEQQSHAFTLLFNGWITAIELAVGGNVAARGGVTLIRTMAESGLLDRFKPVATLLNPEPLAASVGVFTTPLPPQTSLLDGAVPEPEVPHAP